VAQAVAAGSGKRAFILNAERDLIR